MQSVRLGVSECPVCGSEYIAGEDTLCQTCGWDLRSMDPSEGGSLSEASLAKEQAKLFWARKMWERVNEKDSSIKGLEWKLADIERQISKVWGRFEHATKERTILQERVDSVLSGMEEDRFDRYQIKKYFTEERNLRQMTQKQVEQKLNQLFSQLQQVNQERGLLQEQIGQVQARLDGLGDEGLPEMLAKLSREIEQLTQPRGGDGLAIRELQGQLEESQQERALLIEQLERERQRVSSLQAEIEQLKDSLHQSQSTASESRFESEMVDALICAMADSSEAVQRMAYALLKRSHSEKAKMALEEYQPYRFFRCLHVLEHEKAVRAVAIDPHGHFLVTGSNDRTIKLWELNTGKPIKTLSGHAGSAIALAISPNGELLASGSGDNTIKLWHIATGKLMFTLRGHTGWVNTVTFTPKGNTLASGGADKMIKLWNLNTQELLGTFYGHASAVRSLAISPQGNMLASGSNDNMIKIRNLLTGELLHTLTEHTGSVSSVEISDDGNLLASGSNDTTVRLWNLGTGKLLHTLSDHTSAVMSVSISQNRTIASSSDDGTIKIWNLDKATPIHTISANKNISGYDSYILCSTISPEGDKIVTGSDDGKIRIWGVSD